MKKLSSIVISVVMVLAMTVSVFAYQTMDPVTVSESSSSVNKYDFTLDEQDINIAKVPINVTMDGKVSLIVAFKGLEGAKISCMLSKESDYSKALEEAEFNSEVSKGAQPFGSAELKKADGTYDVLLSHYATKGQTLYLHIYNTLKKSGKVTCAFVGYVEKATAKTDETAKKPAKVTGLKVKNKKGKKAVVSWKKAANAKKYTVTYATKKSFKGAKKRTVSGTKATIKKLKKKKTYFFKVRGVNGSKTGSWSAVKKVKIKK